VFSAELLDVQVGCTWEGFKSREANTCPQAVVPLSAASDHKWLPEKPGCVGRCLLMEPI